MQQFLPLSEYRSLVTMGPSTLFQWPGMQFKSASVVDKIRASLDKLPYTYLAAGGQGSQRPLGLMAVRLLWELGELTHQPLKDSGAEPVIAHSFLLPGGKVPMRWSAETPRGLNEVAAGAVDEFLQSALVEGDGVPTRDGGYENAMGEFAGLIVRRNFQLTFRSLPGNGNLAFEIGAFTGEPEEAPEEWENLQFAYMEGGRLCVIDCGSPAFGQVDVSGMRVVRPELPITGFPNTYEFENNGQTQRIWLPMSEGGCILGLSGYAFRENAERTQVCRTMEDGAGAVIRVHLSYVPGWRVGVRNRNCWCWSELSDEFQAQIEEEATEIVQM